ncbi:MAG: PQQ-binding-like beta-propeller repeat protein [Armatimonadota bacterium]|nr:PQQ-binding-like beta-propeller repeat protein [Armatimonadota bacterium]
MVKRLTIIFLTASIAAAGASPACAGSFLYSSSKREIKAGVLVLPGVTPDPDFGGAMMQIAPYPFVFFIMDQRYDLKPRGWEFVNPLSTSSFKNCSAYWKVSLRRTVLDNLLKFDLLYLCANVGMAFTTEDLLKLRNFVDAGGVLWIDRPVGGITQPFGGSFFIRGFDFFTGGGSPPAGVMSRHHPLLSAPYWVTEGEINVLGAARLQGCYLQVGAIAGNGGAAEPTVLLPIVKNIPDSGDPGNKFAYVAGAHYGSGAIVATAGGIGEAISVGVGAPGSGCMDTTNRNVRDGLAYAPAGDLKLAYNICNWSASWMTFRKDVRRAAGSIEDLGGAMIERWKMLGSPPDFETSAVLYKNVFFYADGRGTVYALDAVPGEDLDGDGNPDDGVPDNASDPFDTIWTAPAGAPAGGPCSAPMVAEVRLEGGDSFEIVAVQSRDGWVRAWQAFPTVPPGILGRVPVQIAPRSSDFPAWPTPLPPSGSKEPPHPLAFHNGWIYQAGVDGVFRGYSPAGPSWVCPNVIGSLPGSTTYAFKSAPVIGTIENDDNGAVIDVAFIAGKAMPHDQNGNQTGGPNDHILALGLAIKNERLRAPSTFGSGTNTLGYYDTMFRGRRIFDAGGDTTNPDYPQVWATDSDGVPIPGGGINWPPANPPTDGSPNQPGVGCFAVTKLSGTAPPPTDWILYANYRLDFPAPGNGASPNIDFYTLRPEFTLIPGAPGGMTLDGAPALGRDGLVYLCAQRPPGGLNVGEVQSIQLGYAGNTANSHWDLKWRYPLHAGTNEGVMSHPGVVLDHTRDLIGPGTPASPVGYAIRGLQPSPSPALAGGKLFVTAWSDGKNLPFSNGALLCFKAKPDMVIRIHEPLTDQNTRRKRDVRIWQPDPLFAPSANLSLPNDAARVPSQMIDYDRGTISIPDFSTLTPQSSGFARCPITPALPVIVFVDGVQLPSSQVDLGQWNNLLWYMAPYHNDIIDGIKPCGGIHAPPVVVGDYVYFQCDDGYIFSVDVETGVTNGGQVFSVPPMYAASDQSLTKHVRWNEPIGGPTQRASGPTRASIAAANGLMGVVAADGIHGFDNPLTLVADNRRLVELDGGGKVTWTVESISKPTTTSSGSQLMELQTINRPAMAKIMNSGDYIVADTGNNQILRIDRSGNVTWWMTSFSDPQGLLRPGDPLQLNGPTDVYAWAGMEKIGGDTFSVLHHLVADGGNHRIVDIVDKYDATGALVPPGQQLNWVSHTLELGKRYEFRNVQLWAHPADMGRQFVLAAISNYSIFDSPYQTQTQQTGGSVALLDYRTVDPNDFSVAMKTGDIVKNVPGGAGLYTAITGLGPTNSEPLAGLRYLHRSYTGVAADPWHDLVCTSSGVYEVRSDAGIARTWLTSEQYRRLPRSADGDQGIANVNAPLIATSAKIVGADRILISNGYSGPTQPSPPFLGMEFSGEVFEVQNDSNGLQIMWYAPRIRATQVSPAPEFILKQVTENGGNLEQPSCVDRIQ